MSYRVRFTPRALADLEDLPESIAWAALAFCQGPLAENPQRVGKALRNELEGLHSARRGEYRIIYRIDDDVIVVDVIRIRHRGQSYRS